MVPSAYWGHHPKKKVGGYAVEVTGGIKNHASVGFARDGRIARAEDMEKSLRP